MEKSTTSNRTDGKSNKSIKILYLISAILLCLVITFAVLLFTRQSNISDTTLQGNISDTTLQGNFTNWGSVCYDSSYVYYSDFANGIYRSNIEDFRNYSNRPSTCIAEGNYTDLGIIGDYILCIKLEPDGYSYVVRINKKTYVEEIVSEKYESHGLIGQDIVDGDYYYTVNLDRLYYIHNTIEECTTPYRYVLKKSKYGLFSTSENYTGLEYTSPDGKVQRYEYFNDIECNVMFFDDQYAIICIYNDGNNQQKVYKLNLHTQEITTPFDTVLSEHNYCFNSINLNTNNDLYILTVTYMDDNQKYVTEVYSFPIDSSKASLIFSTSMNEEIYFSTTSVIEKNILFTIFPISSFGKYYIHYIK